MRHSPRYAFCADDFTGATDTLATAAQAGLRARLYLDAPPPEQLEADGEPEVVGIATAARSLAPEAMAQALEPIGRALARLGIPVLHYKTCSTFDSAPHVGSIGAAVLVLRKFVADEFVPIVGGQPNLRRYCLFGNLYAAAGANGEVHRIDRHPTMSRHPVTPMHEADLRLHFDAQGLSGVRSVDYTRYRHPIEDLHGTVLFDVGAAEDLAVIGRLIWRRARGARLLAVGPSSVAQALIAAWTEEGSLGAASRAPAIGPARGPVFMLSGSLSPVTAEQIRFASSYAKIMLDAARLASGETEYAIQAARRCVELLRSGRHVLAHTSHAPADNRDGATIATICGQVLSAVLREVPLSRVGVSGGDTSSHAVKALGIDSLSYAAQLVDGVALCRVHAQASRLDGMELMLKGGQMGPPGIFERLIST